MTSRAAPRAGRAVFRHLESFCEQLIDNFCGAARHGLTLTRGIAALTLLPLRALWRPAIPDCFISASFSRSMRPRINHNFDQWHHLAAPNSTTGDARGVRLVSKGGCLKTIRTRSTRPRKRAGG